MDVKEIFVIMDSCEFERIPPQVAITYEKAKEKMIAFAIRDYIELNQWIIVDGDLYNSYDELKAAHKVDLAAQIIDATETNYISDEDAYISNGLGLSYEISITKVSEKDFY